MDYNAPSGSTNLDADYVGATASTQGSKLPPNVPTLVQRELVNVELLGGLIPANGDRTQVGQAIGRGLWLGTLGANPNALVGTLGAGAVPTKPGVLQTLNPWTRLRGLALQTNTQASVTLTVVGIGSTAGYVTAPLLKRDGSPLAVGDVPTLYPFAVQVDASGNFRMDGSVASDGVSASQSLTIVKAAGAIFNFKTLQSATRTNASAASAGLQVPVLSGLTYPKKSATSNVAVTLGFFSYSPVTAGQGNGAATARLVTSTAVFADFGLNSSLNISGAPVGAGYNTPTIVLPGLPIGNIGLGLTYRRDDAASWNTIFNPNNGDFGGIANSPVSTLFIWEFEPLS